MPDPVPSTAVNNSPCVADAGRIDAFDPTLANPTDGDGAELGAVSAVDAPFWLLHASETTDRPMASPNATGKRDMYAPIAHPDIADVLTGVCAPISSRVEVSDAIDGI